MSNRGRRSHNYGDNGEKNGFKNPQYTPSVQHVKPETDRFIRSKLEEFVKSGNQSLQFPYMEKAERKRVHDICKSFNLASTSSGQEPYRIVNVKRRSQKIISMPSAMASETKALRFSRETKNIICDLIRNYPIDSTAVKNHLSTTSSQRSRSNVAGDGIAHGVEMLVAPKSNCSADMARQRHQLPACQQRDEILRAIDENQVVLITGGTGCGKTTQVPQFLLEQSCEEKRKIRIICTQPRRLPAIAVAERVAKERSEQLGGTVGYHIRLEQKTSRETVLTYCTSGVLLRMLTQDNQAKDVSHIILDEVHEREQNTDYLLIALKTALQKRSDFKIILMSATMEGNLEMFMNYFGNGVKIKHIDIPSRLYNVDRIFLNEVLALTGHVPEESIFGGGVFATGFGGTSSFPSVGAWAGSKKDDKAEFWNSGQQQQPGHHLQTVQTTPNMQTMVPTSNCMPQMSMHTAMSTGSHRTKDQTKDHWYDNVAQQLATHAPTSQQQQMVHQQSQPPQQQQYANASSQRQTYSQPPPSNQNPYSQPPPMFYQAPYQSSSNYGYSRPPPAITGNMPHSATWGDGMDQMTPGYYYPPSTTDEIPQEYCHQEVVDLPMENVNPDAMQQLGYGPVTYQGQEQTWQHTQSYPVLPPNQPSTHQLQSWDSQNVMHPQTNFQQEIPHQYAQPSASHSGAMFYLPNEDQKNMSFYGNAMDPAPSFSSQFPPPPYNENDFSSQMKHEEYQNSKRRYMIMNAIPPQLRGDRFSKNVLGHLERVRKVNLVESYMELGGSQFADCVDQDLIISVIRYCMQSDVDGAILVFLPGYDDIIQIRDKISKEQFAPMSPEVYILHSQLNSADQQRVFEAKKEGYRKIILSTNIAEASVTIDDVVFVIDTGKVKEKSYDHTSRISQLKVSWIAKSNAEQRSGRAGRCRDGYCFRLYSASEYDNMNMTQTAEMQRSAIHDVCLHAKMFAPESMTVKKFLEMAPEPPPGDAIDHSMRFLKQLGALYSESSASDMDMPMYRYPQPEAQLTDLGRLIAVLPLDPQLARLLLFGVALRCLSSVVTLVAALSNREPFVLPGFEERERANDAKDRFGLHDFSDHITLMRVVNEGDTKNFKELQNFCKANFLAINTLRMASGVRRQLVLELKRARLVSPDKDVNEILKDPLYNEYSDCWPMVQAAIVAGCYPGVGYVKNGNKLKKIRTTSDNVATLHPSSVIKRQLQSAKRNENKEPTAEFLVFQEFAKIDDTLTLKTVSVVPPAAIILFAGAMRLKKNTVEDFRITERVEEDAGDSDMDEDDEDLIRDLYVLQLDDFISVRAPFEDLQRLVQLRFKFMTYFLELIGNPRAMHYHSDERDQLLRTMARVLTMDHESCNFNPVTKIAPVIPRSNYSGPNRLLNQYAGNNNFSHPHNSFSGFQHNNNSFNNYNNQNRYAEHQMSQTSFFPTSDQQHHHNSPHQQQQAPQMVPTQVRTAQAAQKFEAERQQQQQQQQQHQQQHSERQQSERSERIPDRRSPPSQATSHPPKSSYHEEVRRQTPSPNNVSQKLEKLGISTSCENTHNGRQSPKHVQESSNSFSNSQNGGGFNGGGRQSGHNYGNSHYSNNRNDRRDTRPRDGGYGSHPSGPKHQGPSSSGHSGRYNNKPMPSSDARKNYHQPYNSSRNEPKQSNDVRLSRNTDKNDGYNKDRDEQTTSRSHNDNGGYENRSQNYGSIRNVTRPRMQHGNDRQDNYNNKPYKKFNDSDNYERGGSSSQSYNNRNRSNNHNNKHNSDRYDDRDKFTWQQQIDFNAKGGDLSDNNEAVPEDPGQGEEHPHNQHSNSGRYNNYNNSRGGGNFRSRGRGSRVFYNSKQQHNNFNKHNS